ncbi:hypothetical protein D3C76_787890 [compost metagenome]
MLLQFKEQRDIADQQARFNQVGGDGKIRQSFEQTLFERADAVADFQLHVPQQRQQFTHFLRLLVGQFFAAQYQQVDVGKRVQFTASVTADRNQCDVTDLAEAVIDPQALQQLIDKFGARFDKLFCRNAFVKGFPQPALKNVDMRFDIRHREIALRPDAGVVRLVGQGGQSCVRILFR